MPEYTYPLIAIRHDGKTFIANTLQEATVLFDHLGTISDNLVERCVTRYVTPDGHEVYEEDFRFNYVIVRDDEGRTVHDCDIPIPLKKWRPRREIFKEKARYAAERNLPIPGTGRCKNSGYHRRYAQNTTMRAQDFTLDLDLEEWGVEHMKVGRRRAKYLPRWIDDVPPRVKQRNWKTQRNTQWR